MSKVDMEDIGNSAEWLRQIAKGYDSRQAFYFNGVADHIEALEAAIVELEPYTDAIVCYASTISEHDANRVVKLFADLKAEISVKGASRS